MSAAWLIAKKLEIIIYPQQCNAKLMASEVLQRMKYFISMCGVEISVHYYLISIRTHYLLKIGRDEERYEDKRNAGFKSFLCGLRLFVLF